MVYSQPVPLISLISIDFNNYWNVSYTSEFAKFDGNTLERN